MNNYEYPWEWVVDEIASRLASWLFGAVHLKLGVKEQGAASMSNFSPEQRTERAFQRAAYVLRSIWEEDGRSYDTRLLDEPLIPSGYVTVGESVRGSECREHVVPRDAICRECVRMFSAGSDVLQVAAFIHENVRVVLISRDERHVLDSSSKLNLRKRMPDGWSFGQDIFARLRLAGIEFRLFAPMHATCDDAGA